MGIKLMELPKKKAKKLIPKSYPWDYVEPEKRREMLKPLLIEKLDVS